MSCCSVRTGSMVPFTSSAVPSKSPPAVSRRITGRRKTARLAVSSSESRNQTTHSGTPFRPTKSRSPPESGWVCQKRKGKRLSIWRKTTCRGRLTDVAVRRPVTRSGGRLATMTQSTLATRIIIRFNTVPGPFPPPRWPSDLASPHFYLPLGRLPPEHVSS